MKKISGLIHRNNYGFTLMEMMIVAVIIGILCAIAIPNFITVRNNTYRDACITNLRRIVAAKEHWAMETGAADTDTPTAVQLDPYIKDGTTSLVCPVDASKTFSTSYNINSIATNPACKIQPATHVLP
ncbi:MAG: prepilin-type N-terminal cleavage/methylation domain-containing protein [Candidatus Omnitrophica bacterium]|nr:prepilin-type N-terminal cleavage/methylation domain-containing protein [Candidatus Omnitrophota bacterium]